MRSSKVGTDHILDGMTKFQFLSHAPAAKHKIIPAAIHKTTPNQLISREDFLPIDLQDFQFHTHPFFVCINPTLRFTTFRALYHR